MIVTPVLSDRTPGATIFFAGNFPVFFQKGRTPPPVGVLVNCMITKCIYSRFASGALDYSRLRFMIGSPVYTPDSPSPLLVSHSGFHFPNPPGEFPDEESPIAFLTQDVIVNGTLVATAGTKIESGLLDLAAAPFSSPKAVPGRIYIRKRDNVLRAVGIEDLSSLSYFYHS